MGRGRAKAKQTKVARDLKYRSYSTDFGSLERELRGGEPYEPGSEPELVETVEDDVEDDQYAHLADRYGDDDEPEETQDYRRIG
jgi:hypothetical protein